MSKLRFTMLVFPQKAFHVESALDDGFQLGHGQGANIDITSGKCDEGGIHDVHNRAIGRRNR